MKRLTSRFAMMLFLFGLLIAACGEEAATATSPGGAGTSTTEEMMDDVLAVAEAAGDLGISLAGLDSTGIMEDSMVMAPFPLFIPTDEALAVFLEGAGMSQEEAFAAPVMLQSILGYHAVTMMEDSEMVMRMDGQTFTTLNGAPLEVTVDGVLSPRVGG